MEKRHRVFIAINLPEDIKRELEKIQQRLAGLFAPFASEGSVSGPAKWTSKDNLHITLEFLGDLTDEEVGDACLAVKEAAKLHKPFSVNLNKVLYGPPRLRSGQAPKMIWVNGEKSDELKDLKKDLQEYLLEKISYRPESRGFTPHITMARIKEWEFRAIEPEERPEINEDIDLFFTVETIEVMESELKRGGPVYTVLESCELRN